MTEKAPKKTKSTIQVNRNRGGGKKRPDLFANLRNKEHPLDSLLPEELNLQLPHLDSQTFNSLDSQINQIGIAKENSLDSQINETRQSKDSSFGKPHLAELDSQKEDFGKPKQENLDSLIAKEPIWIAKEPSDLDSLTAKKKSLAIQKPKKEEEKGKWTKYDRSRSRKGIFLRTDDDLTKQFKQFCIQHDLEFAQGTELAWQQFMNSLDSQKSSDLDSLIAVNNKQLITMWKTKPFIINLYYAYNKFFTSKVKWTPKDDKNGQLFNDYDPRIVELGILQTQSNLFQEGNEKTTINGFLYYANEIKKFLVYEESPETLDTILRINRENWKKITGKEVDLDFLKRED